MTKPSRQLVFADAKEPGAMRTIGEVASAVGIKQHVLRYWEQQFPMLRPLKRGGNRRYYRPADVDLVVEIDRLVNHEGYTLKGARQAIEISRRDQRTGAADASSSGAAQTSGNVRQLAASVANHDVRPGLQKLRDRLAAALNA